MNLFYRFSVTPVRGSVVDAAAYVSGQRYRDNRTGLTVDHSARRAADRDEVAHMDLRSPALTPLVSEALWNAVAANNKHPKAIGGRMIVAAFPHILTLEQMIERASKYADALVRRYRVAVQFAIHVPRRHRPDDADDQGRADREALTTNNNWHVHFLLSYCQIDATGNPGPKQLGIDPVSARCNGLPNFCKVERPAWAAEINDALRVAGSDHEVDHRSLADRGLADEPTMPLGPQRWALEQQGISTDIGRRNAAVLKRNAARRRRLAELVRLQDVGRTLEAVNRQSSGRRLPRRAVAQFPWTKRTLGGECHASILYVHQRAGVMATRDGGRFVQIGRDAHIVDLGQSGQILTLLWQRHRSTLPGTWSIEGPPAVMAKVNRYFEDRARSTRRTLSEGAVSPQGKDTPLDGEKLLNGVAAAEESSRRLDVIAQLGSRRHESSDSEPQPGPAAGMHEDDLPMP